MMLAIRPPHHRCVGTRNRAQWALMTVILVWMGLVMPSGAHAAGALEQLQATVDGVLEILAKTDLSDGEKQHQIEPIIRDQFDFKVMSQGALSVHWRTTSDTDRAVFVDRFSRLLIGTYLAKIRSYSGERVRYKGVRANGPRAVVETALVSNGREIPIRYKLRQRGGKWLVYDVIVEEISLLRNYRTNYREIVRREGLDGLLIRMGKKLASLEQADH